MGKFIDLKDLRFGKLIVLDRLSAKGEKHIKWRCRCECGNVVDVSGTHLKSGHTKSCGCIVRNGGSGRTPEKSSYLAMLSRCLNPKNPKYGLYGGRGISVCKRWADDFGWFLSDMGERPSMSHTLDRIDNDKGYGPENCRWATFKQQSRNTSRNRWIELNGVKKVKEDWIDVIGIARGTWHDFKKRHCLTDEETLMFFLMKYSREDRYDKTC